MHTSPSITFVLNTNNANSINANRTTMTWDLDVRNIVGANMFDDYQWFDLRLNQVIVLTGSATDANNNVVVRVQGLQFFGNNGTVSMALIKSGSNLVSSLTNLSSNPTHTFNKPNSTLSVTISLNSVATNLLSTVNFGHQAYLFTITGNKKISA